MFLGPVSLPRHHGTAPAPTTGVRTVEYSEGRATCLSPLGALIAEIREEQRSKGPTPRAAPSRPHGPEPELLLETSAVSQPPPGFRDRISLILPVSLGLHGLALLMVVVVPLLWPDALPPLASGVKAFFVAPPAVPPPPPPPPPPSSAATLPPRAKPMHPEAVAFTSPVESPQQVIPAEAVELGIPGVEPGGVERGVLGGVVGRVVGGLPETPEPIKPVRVGGEIKEPTKLKHVSPVYPDIAVRARVHGSIILECTVSPQGRVTGARVLRGIPLLDAAAVAAVKQWVYTPTLWDGVPVPVIMTVTVRFEIQ